MSLIVRDWETLFENSKSKQYKNISWVPVPNNYDSEGILNILDLEDGLEIFGIFILLLELASKNTPRGTICTSGVHDMYRKIARKLRIDTGKIERALEVLQNEPFNWVMYSPCTGHVQEKYTELNRIEQNRTINTPENSGEIDSSKTEKKEEPISLEEMAEQFEDFWKKYGRKGSKKAAKAQWGKLLPEDWQNVIDSVDFYFKEKPDAQYRKDAERFLRDRIFEDVLERAEEDPTPDADMEELGIPQNFQILTDETMNQKTGS